MLSGAKLIKVSGPGFKGIQVQLQRFANNVDVALLEFGNKTKTQMQTIINSNKKRASGANNTLANSITVEQGATATGTWVGVANIEKLPPYWKFVNYGGLYKVWQPKRKSFFVPGTFNGKPPIGDLKGKGTERFKYNRSSNTGFMIRSDTRLRPMRYIEKTYSWIWQNWNPYWSAQDDVMWKKSKTVS